MIFVKLNFLLEPSKHTVFRTGLDADNVDQMHHDQEEGEDAPDHDQSPRPLVGSLIRFPDGAELAMRKDSQGDEDGGQAEADNPVEQGVVSSISLGRCGVFAQKNGAFASSQMARYAAIECSGQYIGRVNTATHLRHVHTPGAKRSAAKLTTSAVMSNPAP